jgi:hypothetical protein
MARPQLTFLLAAFIVAIPGCGSGVRAPMYPVGAAYCWGYNFYGQVGDGSTTDRSVPTRVISP